MTWVLFFPLFRREFYWELVDLEITNGRGDVFYHVMTHGDLSLPCRAQERSFHQRSSRGSGMKKPGAKARQVSVRLTTSASFQLHKPKNQEIRLCTETNAPHGPGPADRSSHPITHVQGSRRRDPAEEGTARNDMRTMIRPTAFPCPLTAWPFHQGSWKKRFAPSTGGSEPGSFGRGGDSAVACGAKETAGRPDAWV